MSSLTISSDILPDILLKTAWLETILLALIQGITEFLPISSSAHLILIPRFVHWEDQGLAFDIAVHVGTLLAVILYFRQDLLALIHGFLRTLRDRTLKNNPDGRLAWAIGWATVPVGLAGLLLHDTVATIGRNPTLIATASIVFGILLWWTDAIGTKRRPLTTWRWQDVLSLGLAQTLALIPGASRSGVTMTVGLLVGFDRASAARFSFLMAIPVITLAGALNLVTLWNSNPPSSTWWMVALGVTVSALSAYLVIGWLLTWLKQRGMAIFALYRIVLGIFIFVLEI